MRVRGGQSSESRLSPLLGSALLSPAAGREGASLALGCRWTCTKAAAVSPHVGLSLNYVRIWKGHAVAVRVC